MNKLGGLRVARWLAVGGMGSVIALSPATQAKAAEHLPLELFGSAAQPSFGHAEGMAVDPTTGDLLVIDAAAGTVSRFNPDGTPADFSALSSNAIDGTGAGDETPQNGLSFGSASEVQIAVDGSGGPAAGDIYVTQAGSRLVDIFSSAGAYLGQLTASSGGEFGEACGVAVDSSGDVYVGDYSSQIHKFVPAANPPVNANNTANFETVLHPCSLAAGAGHSSGSIFVTEFEGPVRKLSGTTGALQRVVSKESNTTVSVDPASGHLYVARAGEVNEFTSSSVTPVASVVASSTVQGVAVDGSSGDLYLSRSGAANVEASAAAPPRPAIYAEQTTGVGMGEAELQAEINPNGLATTYTVEYGTSTSYDSSTPEVGAGSDKNDHLVNIILSGLAPGTTYHWRVVATNAAGIAKGTDQSFITYKPPGGGGGCSNESLRTGAAAQMADCRAYEMVSPLDKNNSDIVILPNVTGNPAGLDQSASGGEKLTYSTFRAFGDAEGAPYTSQYIASRSDHGWLDHSISSPQGLSKVAIAWSAESPYRFFSADLCGATLLQFSDRALAPGAVEGFPNIYWRQNCGAEGYEALTTVEPPTAEPLEFRPDVQGTSADGKCAVFRTADQLTPNAHPQLGVDSFQLYESCGGVLRLVSAEPDGTAAPAASVGTGSSALPMRTASVKNAVSTNGERVYWSALESGAGAIYLRENSSQPASAISGGVCTEPTKACTVPVSAPVSALPARFWAASADGSRALYTIEKGSSFGVLNGDLYEYDAASQSSTPIATEVAGLLGASEDLSRIYMISRQALAGGAEAGMPNLYLYESGSFTFIAVLPEAEAEAVTDLSYMSSPVNAQPFKHSAYVTPDGRHLAFMSAASLTGYDNVDRESHEPDSEVYVYDVESHALDCASCNPSGARPQGRELLDFGKGTGLWRAGQITSANSQLYAPRVLSDGGGRAFFESFEALVPGDINGKADVYEWEAPGVGTCRTAGPDFSSIDGGCVSLVSSGRSSRDSSFVDAAADGTDVFLATIASLVPQDEGLVDIYDARSNGGFPPPPGSPAPCIGESCQPPASSPESVTPASSSFRGPGNLTGRERKHGRRRRRHGHRKQAARRHRRDGGAQR